MQCAVCGKETSRGCSRCKIVSYCSRECQAKGWPEHNLHCDAQREIYELLFPDATVGGRTREFPFSEEKDPREQAIRRRVAEFPPRERSATHQRLLAFAEGHHPRLGQASPLSDMPRDLMRDIADILIADDRRARLAVYDRDASVLRIYLADPSADGSLHKIAKYDLGDIRGRIGHSCPAETSLVGHESNGMCRYTALGPDEKVKFKIGFYTPGAHRMYDPKRIAASTKDYVALENEKSVIVYPHTAPTKDDGYDIEFAGFVEQIVPFCDRFVVRCSEEGTHTTKIIDPGANMTTSRPKWGPGYVPCPGWKMLIEAGELASPTIRVAYANDGFSEFPVTEYVATPVPGIASLSVRVLGGMIFYETEFRRQYVVYAPPAEPPFPAALDPLVIDDPFYEERWHSTNSHLTEIMSDTVALHAGVVSGHQSVHWVRRDAAGHIRVTSTPFMGPNDGNEVIGLDVAAAKACVIFRHLQGKEEKWHHVIDVVDVRTGKVDWFGRFTLHEDIVPILTHLNRW